MYDFAAAQQTNTLKLPAFFGDFKPKSTFSIHHNNIHSLVIEMYRVVNGKFSEIMNDVFQIRNNTHYNLGYAPSFLTEPVHSVFVRNEPASYLGPKIWERTSKEVKMINSLARFKKEIRKWKPVNCPSRICKVFITNLGFI